jgi:hypothetical protein
VWRVDRFSAKRQLPKWPAASKPLTTTVADTEDLLDRAEKAGVRHAVGLLRRMGPSARYLRDLLAEGYVGQIRSVRMHVSMVKFQQRYQNSHRIVISGIVGYPLNADTLDGLLIRLFDRVQ